MTIQQNTGALHDSLLEELASWFRVQKRYRITGLDLPGQSQPLDVQNPQHIGDGKNKRPDADAFDDAEQVYVRGEAKTGNGDLTTDHTKTQFRLFADRQNRNNGKMSLLYIIVPASKKSAVEAVLRELGLLGKPHVLVVSSGKHP